MLLPSETAIVGFIDILCYESLVKRIQDKSDIIQKIENIFRNNVVNFPQKFHKASHMDDSVLKEYRSKIIQTIRAKAISDTFLFTLYLDRLDFKAPAGTDFDPITDGIWSFFSMIEIICLNFIVETGHVFRGGVAIDKHYENNIDYPGNLFIFSTAYLKALKAEKRHVSRIIIDDDLRTFFRSMKKFDYIKKHFYEDFDKIDCIDLYSFFKGDELKPSPEKKLKDIKSAISANISFNKGDAKALLKQNYFAGYHNRFLKENGYNHPDLYIWG